MTRKNKGPVSLYPLSMEQAVSALLSTPPPKKGKSKPKKTRKVRQQESER
jgi:hypothetical protein